MPMAVDTRHTTCGLMGRVHEGIVKAKPMIERVGPVDTLERVEFISNLRAMT